MNILKIQWEKKFFKGLLARNSTSGRHSSESSVKGEHIYDFNVR